MRQAVRLYRLQEILEVAGISRSTLRSYEEIGLVVRTELEGRNPLYDHETVERVLRIQRLRKDLGVNLAGVQVILDMRARIEELQQSLEEVVDFVQTDLRHELDRCLRREEKSVILRPLTHPPTRRD